MTFLQLFLALSTPLPPQHYVPGLAISYRATVDYWADLNLVPRWLARKQLTAESTDGLYMEAWRKVKVGKRWVRKLISHGAHMIALQYERKHVRDAGMKWKDYDWKNPSHSARVGLSFLGRLIRQADGDLVMATAAYTAGWAGIQSSAPLGPNTIRYLREIFE